MTAAIGSAVPCETTLDGTSADEALARFRDLGYLVVPGLFSRHEVDALNHGLARLIRECGADGRHPLPGVGVQFETAAATSAARLDAAQRELLVRKYFDFGQADPFFWSHLRDPRIVAILDLLLGRGAQLLQCMALVKPPGIGSPKDWHQDIAYFPIAPATEALGVWIACDDADLDNGCMQVVPRSHREGKHPHVDGPSGWKLPDDAVAARAAGITPLPMAAGSALVFDAALWHFTDHNRSPRRRRALQYHYVSARTRREGGELWALDATSPPRAVARA